MSASAQIMTNEALPPPDDEKRSIARLVLSVLFWICFLAWPCLLAIPNPLLGEDKDGSWRLIQAGWLIFVLIEIQFPSPQPDLKRSSIAGNIVNFLVEVLLAFRQ